MKEQAERLFKSLMALLFGVWFLLLVLEPSGIQRQIFFQGTGNFLADFFNLLRYIADRDPYFNTINGFGQKAYLPIAYLLLYPFSQLDDFGMMTLAEVQASHFGILSAILWSIASSLLLFVGLWELSKKYKIKFTLPVFFFLSSVFLFTIERGNMVLISGACICFFLAYYDSSDPKRRFLAYACLALASSLKVFPVIFGIILLREKRYKAILIAAFLTILMVFLPFLFFRHGLGNVPQLVSNLHLNVVECGACVHFPRFGIPSFCCTLFEFIHRDPTHVVAVMKYVTLFLSALSLLMSIFVKKVFFSFALITFTLLNYPDNSAFYTGIYLFPIILLYFSTFFERNFLTNALFLGFFILILNPFQLQIGSGRVLNAYIAQFSVIILWMMVMAISLISIIRQKQKKHLMGEQ